MSGKRLASVNDEAQSTEDMQLLEEALVWVRTKEDGVWRSLIYHVSWLMQPALTCRFQRDSRKRLLSWNILAVSRLP